MSMGVQTPQVPLTRLHHDLARQRKWPGAQMVIRFDDLGSK